MFEVYDVDNGVALFKFPLNTSLSKIVHKSAVNLKTTEDSLFLLSPSGITCQKSAQATNYIKDSEYLLLFHKGKINESFPVDKIVWNTFRDFPNMDWYYEQFNFDEYNLNQTHEFCQTYEKLLFDLSQNSRKGYAKYVTSQTYLNASEIALKIRLRASEALINSCETYFFDLKKNLKKNSEEIFEFKLGLDQKIAEFNSKESQGIIQNAGIFTELFQKLKFAKFGNVFQAKIGKIEADIIRLERNYFPDIEGKIAEMRDDFNKMSNSLNQTLVKVQKCGSRDQEGNYLLNFAVCSSYSKLREDLALLTNESYHPKTQVFERIKSMGGEIESHINTSESLSTCTRAVKKNENLMKIQIDSFSEFYKTNFQNSVICISDLKQIVKNKLEKYYSQFKHLEAKKKILDFPMVIAKSCENLTKFVYGSPNQENILKAFKKIYEEVFSYRKHKLEFLHKHGDILPSRFPGLVPIFEHFNIQISSRGYREKSEFNLEKFTDFLKNSCESNENFEICPEKVTRAEIEKFYKRQIDEIQAGHSKMIENYEEKICSLEKEIENVEEGIDLKISENQKRMGSLIGLCEEIELSGCQDMEKRISEKLLALASKNKQFQLAKVKMLNDLREENKIYQQQKRFSEMTLSS